MATQRSPDDRDDRRRLKPAPETRAARAGTLIRASLVPGLGFLLCVVLPLVASWGLTRWVTRPLPRDGCGVQAQAVAPPRAYVAVGDTLRVRVRDTADPTRPKEVGQVTLPGSADHWLDQDGRLYVTYRAVTRATMGLAILDVSSVPDQPTLLGVVEGLQGIGGPVLLNGRAIVSYGAKEGYGGIHVVDVSQPGTPAVISTLSLFSPERRQPGYVEGMGVVGNLLYLGWSNPGGTIGGLRVLDLGPNVDLQQAKTLATLDLGPVSQLAIVGKTALVTVRTQTLTLSLDDPIQPRVTDTRDWRVQPTRGPSAPCG